MALNHNKAAFEDGHFGLVKFELFKESNLESPTVVSN